MTPELQERLQESKAPFDGWCIHNADELSLSQLRQILAVTMPLLEPSYPNIFSFHDWHEHDGFVLEAKPETWNSLREQASTDRALFDSRASDFAVRVAVYSPTFDWLLRYNVDDEDESDYSTAWCDFDLSVSEESAALAVANSVLTQFPSELLKCKSQPRFLSRRDKS